MIMYFCGPSIVFTNILKPRSEFPQQGSEYYQKTIVKNPHRLELMLPLFVARE